MKRYDHIALIYNPKSSKNALARAKQLAAQIKTRKKSIGISADLTPTTHAGHARELAKDLSLDHAHPLIVSVSGDGGYNEVINGIMDAKTINPKVAPVAAVYAAGNANDHTRVARGNASLIELIAHSKPLPMDIISLNAQTKATSFTRYAHSYIGLGISSKAGYELNKHGKTRYKEAVTLLKTFWDFKPIEIRIDGTVHSIDSLIFANISEMAKVIKLDAETKLQDNSFQIIRFDHSHKPHLIYNLLKSVLWHADYGPEVREYRLETISSEKIQFDGEIELVPAGADVRIESVSGVLLSLYVPM